MTIKEFLDKLDFSYGGDNNMICDIGAIEIYYDSGNIIKRRKNEEYCLVPLFISDLLKGNYDNKEWINQEVKSYNVFISACHNITLSIILGG